MVSHHLDNKLDSVGASEVVFFAGDDVRLAGQIDYPVSRRPNAGYPLIFIIQHATCIARDGYTHITRIGTEMGAAVFRWDKRGTGASGSGGSGSVTIDTLRAYEVALSQPSIDPERVIIFAQNEGTLLLGEAFGKFAALQTPRGVILAGNMLDERAVLAIDVPVHLIISKNDWNDWRVYAQKASEAHEARYRLPSSYFVATNTNRLLRYTSGNLFHRGAETSIKHWLEHTCQIFV